MKIVLWYLAAILLLLSYFYVDEFGFIELIKRADQHRVDWGFAFLVIYGVIKYLAGITGALIVILITVFLIRLRILNTRQKLRD